MFYYISFVRPPPTHCKPSERSVPISVQIANDLRTELCEQSYDIFYSWLSSSGSTSPAKLTTWKPSVEYKVLQVNLPSSKRGESLDGIRLALWALSDLSDISRTKADGKRNLEIDLLASNFGDLPFPVMSMPISFVSSAQPKGKEVKIGKQEKIERVLHLAHALNQEERPRRLLIREQTSYDLDKKLWDSGIGLSSWLYRLFDRKTVHEPLVRELHDGLSANSKLDIVELGTGTGLVSIALAALLDPLPCSQTRTIQATDLPSAMELIDHNIGANKNLYPSIDITSTVLDWEDEDVVSTKQYPNGIDVIVLADVTYNTDVFPALVHTIQKLRALHSSTGVSPQVLLAYKERDLAERTLFAMIEQIGMKFELVEIIPGAGGNPVEIYIARNCP